MTSTPINGNDAAVVLRDVHKSFGANKVLAGVNLDAQRGQVTAIIGRSGSGKSTALRCIDRLETGDIAWKHVNGACFRVEDAATEQPRCDALEISPTGPLFGRRMTEAAGTPGQMEAAVLAECGLHKDKIATPGSGKTSGARRPLRVPIGVPSLEAGTDDNGPFLLLKFFLPPGGYATNVVREISKNSGNVVDF